MTSEVYIVTRGSYSDYGIDRVFADRGMADEYVAAMNGDNKTEVSYDGYQVEPYDLLFALPEIRVELTLGVTLVEDGGKLGETEHYQPATDRTVWPACQASREEYPHRGERAIFISVRGFDHDRVRKRYSEIVAQTRADWDVINARMTTFSVEQVEENEGAFDDP